MIIAQEKKDFLDSPLYVDSISRTHMSPLNINNPEKNHNTNFLLSLLQSLFNFQEPAGIFELIEVVGNGTYGQVYKVSHSDFAI
jgi:hypothetical protein